MAIDIALPVVLVLMILLIGTAIVLLTVRSRRQQDQTGHASNRRRDERGDSAP